MTQDTARRRPRLWEVLAITTILVFLIAVFFPVSAGHYAPEWVPCSVNLNRLGVSSITYSGDYDDRFPLATNWGDAIKPYVKVASNFKCPGVAEEKRDGFGYAFNSLMSGAKRDEEADASKPFIFDSTSLAWQSSDPFTSLPKPGRHPGGDQGKNCIGYADGHVKALEVGRAP